MLKNMAGLSARTVGRRGWGSVRIRTRIGLSLFLLALFFAWNSTVHASELPGPPEVSAASAILVDAGSGRVLYEKQAHTRRLIASTTKLMTALVAVESTPKLGRIITILPEYQAEGSSMYLKPGEELTLEELLYGLLLQSGNDAALAIAGGCAGTVETFVDWMNQWAQKLGMADSHFANPNGLDHEEHYSSAYDLAVLGREVLRHETLRQIIASKNVQVAGRTLTNHNKLLWQYEGCVGMKTGYTKAAGRTLVSCAVRDGQTLICVTLNAPDDWEDHKKLLDYGFENWPDHRLTWAGKSFGTVPVTGSLLSRVEVVTSEEFSFPLSRYERIDVKVDLPEWVAAPIQKGSKAGSLIFSVGGTVIGERELVYASDVPLNRPKPSFFGWIRNMLGIPVLGWAGILRSMV